MAAAFEAARDDWGIAASSLIRAMGAAHAGDVSTVTATASVARRHSDAVGYDAFRARCCCSKRGRPRDAGKTAAVDAYRRAFELAGRIGFGDHAPLAGLGRSLANGDLRKAEGSSGRRLRQPRQPKRRWSRPRHVSTSLGLPRRPETLTKPIACTARSSSGRRCNGRTRRARASSSRLAGNPATAAERGLAEIAEPRPDTALT